MQRLILAALGVYRRRLSRYTPTCPQTPSCSTYARNMVQQHGARRGMELAVARLRTCTPSQQKARP